MRFISIYGMSEVSGRIGANVVSHNKYGYYMRDMKIPVNPNSTRQNLIRSRLSLLAGKWQIDLSSSQRGGWDSYAANVTVPARVGSRQYVTGFNLFIRTNQARLESGEAVLEDAPMLNLLGENDPTLAISISEATQNASVTFDNTLGWATEADGHMLLYFGQGQNESRTFYGGPWQYGGKIDGATPTPPTSPATIAVPFPVQAGQKVWCRARILRADGRLSDYFLASVVVVA